MVLSHDASLSSVGFQRAQFPGCQRYYEGATTSQPRINGRLFGSLPPSTVYLLGSCLALALLEARRSLPGQGSWSAGAPIFRLMITWTRLGSLRSPGDPSRAFAAFLDPGRTDMSSSVAATSMLPPRSGQRGLRHWRFRGCLPQLWHLLSYASRYHCCHAQGWLPAG